MRVTHVDGVCEQFDPSSYNASNSPGGKDKGKDKARYDSDTDSFTGFSETTSDEEDENDSEFDRNIWSDQPSDANVRTPGTYKSKFSVDIGGLDRMEDGGSQEPEEQD